MCSVALLGGAGVGLGQDRQELLAAEAAELVLRTQVLADRMGDGREDAVALGVALAVVDRLKWSMSITATVSGRSWRRAPLTMPASCVRMKRRLESPVSGSSNSSASSRLAWATISSCRPLVRPAACTRVTSSASCTGSTRMSCTPRCSAASAASTPGSPAFDEQHRRPEGGGVALDLLDEPFAGGLVDHRDVRLPFKAALEGIVDAVALRHVMARLGQHPAEAPPFPRPPVGHDNTHFWLAYVPRTRGVNLVRASTPRRGGSRPRPAHLLDQRVDAVEAALAAQALEEIQAQLAAVDVAVEVEQERLDEQAAAGDEGRAHADIDGGDVRLAVDFGAAGVDPVVGDDQARVGHEVGGREAERAAALVAVGDDAAHAGTGRRGAAPRWRRRRPRPGRGCAWRR